MLWELTQANIVKTSNIQKLGPGELGPGQAERYSVLMSKLNTAMCSNCYFLL